MSLTVAERNFNTVLSLSSIVLMPASGRNAMSLFLTKECGQTTVQEERGTDDRGSFAILAAIHRPSDLILIKVPIGQPCLKGGRPFSLTTDLTVVADAKLRYVISDECPIGFLLSCAGGWK